MAEPQTLRCSGISVAGSVPFNITWAGIGGNQFGTEQEFREWVASLHEDQSVLRKLFVSWYLGLDPTMSTPSLLLNARIEVNAQGALAILVGA